jgi:hypothetical protein
MVIVEKVFGFLETGVSSKHAHFPFDLMLHIINNKTSKNNYAKWFTIEPNKYRAAAC